MALQSQKKTERITGSGEPFVFLCFLGSMLIYGVTTGGPVLQMVLTLEVALGCLFLAYAVWGRIRDRRESAEDPRD